MRVLAMCSQRFTMVGHNGDHGFVVEAMLLELPKQSTDCRVRVGNFTIVGLRAVLFFEACRRVIRIVSIIQMDPQKEWSVFKSAEPRQGMRDDILRASLHGFVTVGSVPARMKSSIIDIKSTVETRRGAIQWI